MIVLMQTGMQAPRFDLTLWNAVVKPLATDLSFSNLMVGVEIRQFLLQKSVFLHETSFIGKFKLFFPYFLLKSHCCDYEDISIC